MTPTTALTTLWFRLGQSRPDAQPAPMLVEDVADLTTYFRG